MRSVTLLRLAALTRTAKISQHQNRLDAKINEIVSAIGLSTNHHRCNYSLTEQHPRSLPDSLQHTGLQTHLFEHPARRIRRLAIVVLWWWSTVTNDRLSETRTQRVRVLAITSGANQLRVAKHRIVGVHVMPVFKMILFRNAVPEYEIKTQTRNANIHAAPAL